MIEPPIDERDLQGYVDRQLDPARHAQVEAYLAEHPADAERVRAYAQQNQALHALFAPVLAEPVPARLANFAVAKWRPSMRAAASVAAFATALTFAAGLGWTARGYMQAPVPVQAGWTQRALVAHAVYTPEVLHPVEVGAEQEAHLATWLTKRLGTSVRAPHLQAAGFELVGGRLLPDATAPAAQFMYQNAAGLRITLYVNPDVDGEVTAFRYEHNGRVGAFYWIDGGVGYALAGEMERAPLLALAETVYRNLNR